MFISPGLPKIVCKNRSFIDVFLDHPPNSIIVLFAEIDTGVRKPRIYIRKAVDVQTKVAPVGGIDVMLDSCLNFTPSPHSAVRFRVHSYLSNVEMLKTCSVNLQLV
jgi:hypothetical protein